MKLDVKTKFDIVYPLKNYKYYNPNSGPRKRLTSLLVKSCKGFCMYCGKKITTESNENYQIEHSVDKDGNIHQEIDKTGALEHCKYNLAISCNECNQVCKKVVDKTDLAKYEPIPKCPSTCKDLCDKYQQIRNEYIKKNAIVLQPIGIDELGEHAIIYNMAKHIYEPSSDIIDEAQLFLIQNHIDRFRLNGDRFSTSIIELCVKIVDMIEGGVRNVNSIFSLLSLEKPENVIGVDFIDYLRATFQFSSCEEMDRFCRMLVLLDAIY